MHPLVARFHETPAIYDAGSKGLMESLLTTVSRGFNGETVESMTAKAANDDDYWGEEGSFLQYVRPYIVKAGILQIPVKGVLLNDFPFAFGSYATGYDYILKAFLRGLDDDNVKGIAFVINSPGGEVAGCFDAVDKIAEYRGVKPTRAFAHENAYSAAYAVASVADKIVVSRTGGVGSIGVLTSHVSFEEAYKRMGIEITYIFAGDHKVDGNPTVKLPAEVKERIQSKINALYDVFTSTVARNRDMDEKAVRDTQALTFTAQEAVSNGLADSIGTLDDATAEFARELETEDTQMAYTAKEQEAYDAGAAKMRADLEASHATAIATATSNTASAVATAKSEGATAERARISGILACANAADRPAAALAAAHDTDMSIESANTFLGKLPKESAAAPATPTGKGPRGANEGQSEFERRMALAEHPEAGADDEGQGTNDPTGKGNETAKPSRAKMALANSSVALAAKRGVKVA